MMYLGTFPGDDRDPGRAARYQLGYAEGARTGWHPALRYGQAFFAARRVESPEEVPVSAEVARWFYKDCFEGYRIRYEMRPGWPDEELAEAHLEMSYFFDLLCWEVCGIRNHWDGWRCL